MKRLATEQAIGLACFLFCASLVSSENLGALGTHIPAVPARKELHLQGLSGKVAVLGSRELHVEDSRELTPQRSSGCSWLAESAPAPPVDVFRSQDRNDEVALQQRVLSSGQEVWQLPQDLTWNDVSSVLLRCQGENEPRAWALITPAQEPVPSGKAHTTQGAQGLGVPFGLLQRWLLRLRDGLQSSMAWRRSKSSPRAQGSTEGGLGDESPAEALGGQEGQRAERMLQQSLAGQLSAYPGQASGGPPPGADARQPTGQLQAGNPRALFPSLFGSPPTTPPPQQLLQVTNNVDAGQQRPSPSTPLQSVDSASSFSALDVGGSPSAITSPSVSIVNNSPSTPALGAYPDSLLNTPAAFPGESPSPPPAGATGTIALSPPPSPGATAVPINTSEGNDLGEYSAPVVSPASQPPAQAPSAPPVQTPKQTPAPTLTPSPTQTPKETPAPTQTPALTQTPAAAVAQTPAAVPVQAPAPAPAQAAAQPVAARRPPAAAPAQAPVQSPARPPPQTPAAAAVPVATPVTAPAKAPVQAPAQAPRQTAPASTPQAAAPAMVPTLAPAQATSQRPAAAPSTAPSQAPVQAPNVAPQKSPAASTLPVKAPAQAPVEAPAPVPALAAQQTPVTAPAAAPVQAPQAAALSSGGTTPTEAPLLAPTTASASTPAQAPGTPLQAAQVETQASVPAAAPVQAPQAGAAASPPVQATQASDAAAPVRAPVAQLQPATAPAQAPVQAPAALAAVTPAVPPVQSASPPVQAPQVSTAAAPVTAPAASPLQLQPSAAPEQAPVEAPAATTAVQAAVPPVQSAPAPAPGLAVAPAPQQSRNPAGISIPVTPLIGSLTAAAAPAPAAVANPPVQSAGIDGVPEQGVSAPAPAPVASFGAAPVPSISALLDALSPSDRAIVANQNLSSLAGAAGQNLSSVGGQNLSPYSNTTAGALLGSIIATGNPLAPVPAPEAQPLLQAVAAAGVPTPGAGSAARPPSGGAVRRRPRQPVLGASDDVAEAPGPVVSSESPAAAPAGGSTADGASDAEAAALQAAGAPAQSASAALAAAAAASAAAAQSSGVPAPAPAQAATPSRAPARVPAQAPSVPKASAPRVSQAAASQAAPAPVPSLAPASSPDSTIDLASIAAAQDAARAQAPATPSSYASDAAMAEAAIAASLGPSPVSQPAVARAPAPSRGKRVSSASLPSAPAPAPEAPEAAAAAAPEAAPATAPEGNVTLTYQPPSDLSVGGYPTGIPSAPAASAEAPAGGPVSSVPAAAPGPAQAASVPGAAPAPVQVPAAALSPVQAPAPGPSTDRVINLSLNLAGAGLSNLTMQNAVAIREALADQLHLYPYQIQIVSTTTSGGSPQAAGGPPQTRHLLQQGSNEAANLQIQIRPTPDQRTSVLNTLQQPSFNNSLRSSLASQGLQVSSASVASVSESGGPPPPAAPAAPAGSRGNIRQDAWLKKVHGWFMFAAFIILLPAGILTANLFSRTHARHPWWFYTHAVLTGLGSLAGVVGLGIGLVLMVPTHYAMIHRWIGISIIIAIVIQMLLSFLLRPAPEHFLRRSWNLVHWWWGRLIMVAAFGNFFYGLWMVDSGLLWYIVPAAIVAAFLVASALKAVIDYLVQPSGRALPAGGKVQEFQNPMHPGGFNLLGAGSTSQRKSGMPNLYAGSKPGGAGGLRARPSYLGSGEIQLATHAPHSPAGAGVTPAQNGGGSFTAGRRQGSTGRGDSPTRSGGAIPQPQSAFYHQAQELRKDSSPESLNSAELGQQQAGTPSEGQTAGPRQPLHPLPSRASLADRLPPRPSELLKDGKLGAGEQIMAKRRQRRLVPDGALSTRASGALGAWPSSAGQVDEGNPMARRAESFRPRPRPSRAPSSPAMPRGSPGASTSPEEMFGSRAASPGKAPAQSNGNGHSSPPLSDHSVDENEVPSFAARLSPQAQSRIASYGR